MKANPNNGPQGSLSYRVMAFVSKLQLQYLHRAFHNRKLITAVYLFIGGVTALTTITIMAYLTDLVLLFPPLGPSAFILFYTPLSEAAAPRNLLLSHTVALLSGLGALAVAELFFPGFGEMAAKAMNWPGVFAIAIAMGTASLAMVTFRCVHPPAAATALIAAMGYLDNSIQVGGVLAAVLLLAVEAIVFNRVFGGLPYPLWRFDANAAKAYRPLAGHAPSQMSRWQKIAEKTFHHR